MALWSMWSAPLIMGNDLRILNEEDKSILLNKRLLAINRDSLGVWAQKVGQFEPKNDIDWGTFQAFVKPITPIDPNGSGCPSFAVLYLSRRIIGREYPVSEQQQHHFPLSTFHLTFDHLQITCAYFPLSRPLFFGISLINNCVRFHTNWQTYFAWERYLLVRVSSLLANWFNV